MNTTTRPTPIRTRDEARLFPIPGDIRRYVGTSSIPPTIWTVVEPPNEESNVVVSDGTKRYYMSLTAWRVDADSVRYFVWECATPTPIPVEATTSAPVETTTTEPVDMAPVKVILLALADLAVPFSPVPCAIWATIDRALGVPEVSSYTDTAAALGRLAEAL